MIFTASDIASVAESLSRWELGEYISEGFVVLACAGELVADFGRKCLTRAHRNRVERVSTILLVVALLASLICLERANVLSGILTGSIRDKAVEAATKAEKALSDSTIALTQSGQAKEKASAAEDSSGRAKTKADSASAKAAEVDRDLAMTQFLISARSVENIEALTKQLSQFKGQAVVLASYNSDSEGYGLCFVLQSITRAAGMNPTDECGKWNSNGPPLTGVSVRGPDDNAVLSMANMISRTGRLGVQSGPYGNVPKPSTFVILVGARSPFVIGQARWVKAATKKQTKSQNGKR